MKFRLLLVALLAALIPGAALADAPPGATALCNDGTYSFSTTRSGTCSHHGGVAVWLTPTAPAPTPAPSPAPTPTPTPAPAPTPTPPSTPLVPINGSLSGFVSPLNAAEYDAYTLCFASYGASLTGGVLDWGDGTTTNVGASATRVVHVYAKSGSYVITLTCTDSGGYRFVQTTVAAVTATAAPPAAPSAPSTGGNSTSVALGARTKTSGCLTGVLPDHACSPGEVDTRVSQANIQSTVCVPGYTATVRDVPESEKAAVYREYGVVHHAPYSYEVDHIVSLELGGSNNIANLFPEAYAGADGARTKDKLENRMHDLVCAGTITLAAAQQAIATNWLTAYSQFMRR